MEWIRRIIREGEDKENNIGEFKKNTYKMERIRRIIREWRG